MTTRDDDWLAVLDASGSPYTLHRHAAAHTVTERPALPRRPRPPGMAPAPRR
ncbi:hypothetical protein ACH4UM_40675 [Streptomyces sp. NPDC020801]|uniref:hypothetical protein n=1 Tax=unclassified Streptomyces TaxID=2593676 RepID=UPI00378F5AB6